MRPLAVVLLAVLALSGCAGWQPRAISALQYGLQGAALSYKAAQVEDARQAAERVAARPDASVALLDAELAKGRERRQLVGAVLVELAGLLDAWAVAYRAGAEPSVLDVVAAYCRIATGYPDAGLPVPPAPLACPVGAP